jgi:predicted DCC family thiol-disulfide oxidoreductase YuxK
VSAEQIQIVYDGECPFCSTYVRMFRLREMGAVQLFNAREPHPIVDEIRSQGLDLDEGMVLKMGGAYYHGEEVVHRLALMSGRSGLLRRFNYWVFSSRSRSKFLYPILRTGRNLTLKLLGRKKIGNGLKTDL